MARKASVDERDLRDAAALTADLRERVRAFRESAAAVYRRYKASTIVTLAIPPPSHIVCNP